MATKSILSTVEENLKGGLYECTSLEKLPGGTANFGYRGILKTPLADGSKTIVVKHTEGYVASNQQFLLTATRAVRFLHALNARILKLMFKIR